MTSLQQSQQALSAANEIRLARSRYFTCLCAAERPASAFAAELRASAYGAAGPGTREFPLELRGVRVYDALMRLPRYGERRVSELLAGQGIHQHRPLGQLTPRQRRVIANQLDPL